MRHIIFLLTTSLILISCGQNETKQKELELKEREIALKEKELALKQQDSTSKQISSTSPQTTENKETPIIKPIKIISSSKKTSIFPVIELSDKAKADEINSYMIDETMLKSERKLIGANISNLKSVLQSGSDEGLYFKYLVKVNSVEKLILRITCEECTDTGIRIYSSDFTFDLITGSMKVSKPNSIMDSKRSCEDYSE